MKIDTFLTRLQSKHDKNQLLNVDDDVEYSTGDIYRIYRHTTTRTRPDHSERWKLIIPIIAIAVVTMAAAVTIVMLLLPRSYTSSTAELYEITELESDHGEELQMLCVIRQDCPQMDVTCPYTSELSDHRQRQECLLVNGFLDKDSYKTCCLACSALEISSGRCRTAIKGQFRAWSEASDQPCINV